MLCLPVRFILRDAIGGRSRVGGRVDLEVEWLRGEGLFVREILRRISNSTGMLTMRPAKRSAGITAHMCMEMPVQKCGLWKHIYIFV